MALLTACDFVGEQSVAVQDSLRMATAIAVTPRDTLRIERVEMVRVMHEEQSFADIFITFLLARGRRTQADLVDQLFNSSEERLARDLLLLAQFDSRESRKH